MCYRDRPHFVLPAKALLYKEPPPAGPTYMDMSMYFKYMLNMHMFMYM